MKKTKFKLIPLILACVLLLVACGSKTYESVYEEYSSKLESASPKLLEEFNEEAANLSGDISALAELSNRKISELAEISTKGVEEMAEIQLKNNDYEEYQSWANKLTAVYKKEAKKITDAYTKKASGK